MLFSSYNGEIAMCMESQMIGWREFEVYVFFFNTLWLVYRHIDA